MINTMFTKHIESISFSTQILVISFLFSSSVFADAYDARNFLTIATGSAASLSDPRIPIIERQLEMIQENCASGGIHDKIGKAHSLLTVPQSLLQLLTDFVRVSRAQCAKIDDTMLLSLYVLERNAGASHAITVSNLIKNAPSLLAKWRSKRR